MATTARPALSIFPPMEEVQKRKEDLDELIRRSMDIKPSAFYGQRNDHHLNRPKHRVGGRRSPTPVDIHRGEPAPIDTSFATMTDSQPQMKQRRPHPYPLETPANAPRANITRANSIRAPRRCPSVQYRRIPPSAGPPPAQYMRPRNPSVSSSTANSPTSPAESVSTDSGNSMASTNITIPDRSSASSQASNYKENSVPWSPDDVGVFARPAIPSRQGSSRASNRTVSASPVQSLQRQVSSRASHRSNMTLVNSPQRGRVVSPVISEPSSIYSRSSTFTHSDIVPKQSYVAPTVSDEKVAPPPSIFPMYDPSKKLSKQGFRPAHIAPIMIASQLVSKPEYSPSYMKQIEPQAPPAPLPEFSQPHELEKLWSCTNGHVGTIEPKQFTLEMHRPTPGSKKQRICFGPSEVQPFLSLSESAATGTDDTAHEVLIFRHSMTDEDILPIAHSALQPPPAPTLSKIQRGSVASAPNEPAVHVTSISPILATLHSLDLAAKTPQAHTLALVDPNATSPAAARLAERAVADAIARESCTLSWTKTCAQKGKYELHHPSLGVFTIIVEGNIANSFEKADSSRVASITITNPYAAVGNAITSPLSPQSSLYSSNASTTANDAAILAKLDLRQGFMFLDAAAIQQLGNVYLIDVCMTTLLAVAVSEVQRPADPGLIFAAPPPSPFAPGASKKDKKKSGAGTPTSNVAMTLPPKRQHRKLTIKRKTILEPGSDMSFQAIERFLDAEDLPRITRGILSVLGLSFKTAVWILALGVKLTAGMVVGISRLAMKD